MHRVSLGLPIHRVRCDRGAVYLPLLVEPWKYHVSLLGIAIYPSPWGHRQSRSGQTPWRAGPAWRRPRIGSAFVRLS